MRNRVVFLLFCLVLGGGHALADEPGGRVAARVVAGRLVVRCDLSTPARRIPVHLMVDYTKRTSLELHPDALRGLRASGPITMHFPGFRIVARRWEPGPLEPYDTLTKLYATELGETALVGTIGVGILKSYHLTIDLKEGFLHLAPPKEATEEKPEGAVPVDIDGDLVWMPVRFADNRTGVVALSTARYDTILDRGLCKKRGRPAGDVGALEMDTFDFARYVAFRPAQLTGRHDDGAVGVTGLNLLEHFRVEIDRVNRHVVWTETVPPEFPEQDLLYFKAVVTDRAQPVEEWLEKYPDDRLSREAGDVLLERRMREDDQDGDATRRALKWAVETWPEDLRTTRALELMARVKEGKRPDLIVPAGELGLKTGRKDRDSNAVHKIHSILGELRLEKGERKEAWRHLLSAAFGMPTDGKVNYNLGRFYEMEGRNTRAFSRFVQAVISEDTSLQAMAALERVQRSMGQDDAISVDVVERLIEGKVPAYRPPDTYQPKDKNGKTNRVVLAELFTNAHARPCISSDLGFDGLLSHFPRERLAVVAYHLRVPRMEPLVNRIAAARATEVGAGPTVVVINGQRKLRLAGREDDKEAAYELCKDAILAELRLGSDHDLKVDARVEKDTVSGSIVATGPDLVGLKLKVLLVEKGVVFAGRSRIVVHHMVARGLLADVDFEADAKVPFELNVTDLWKATNGYLMAMGMMRGGLAMVMTPRIDPRQISIVAFLLDTATGEVLQAVQMEPIHADGEPE